MYQYDKVSREKARWRDEAGVAGVKGERFGYNAMNQLTGASYDADQAWTENPQNATLIQSYDVTSLNRNAVWNNGQGTSYAFNALNQYTSVNGAAYNYDGNFNLASAPNWSGAYDAQSRLVSAGHDGNVVFFTYDGLGRCVRRVAYRPDGSSTTLLLTYDGWNPIVEWDGAGNLVAHNVYGPKADQILFSYRPNQGTVLWYHLDEHNNVVALLNGASIGLEKYTYDAFGKPTITAFWDHNDVRGTSACENRFMFQGREWIKELGIYDYRHRMYNPDLGRFLQTDPMGLQTEGAKLSAGQKALFSPGGVAPEAFGSSEMNLFRYCGDDPVGGSDPLGLYAPEIVGFSPEGKKQVEEMLNKLSEKSAAFRHQFDGWEKDKEQRLIVPASNDGNFEGKYHSMTKNGPGNSTDTLSWWRQALSLLRGGNNRGGVVYFDPTNRSTAQGRDRDPIFGLAHELGHLVEIQQGKWSSSVVRNDEAEKKASETFAIGWEREAQMSMGVPTAGLRPFP